jgi:MFS family permease
MVSSWVSFTALYAAVFLLLMGVGLLGTLLSLRLTLEGYSAPVTGAIMAAYYAGLVLGSVVCQRLVQRVGHIRAFAAFAAVSTATVMLHGLAVSAPLWAVLRFVTGITNIGLYMVIESWLSECTAPQARGRVFSVYMALTYLGIALGQMLLHFGDARGHGLFSVAAILMALCLVPVMVTHTVHPEAPQPTAFRLGGLVHRAPVGMLGCLTAGLINSAFYALGPVFGSRLGLTVSGVAWMMAVTILGGLVCQWPVGWLSDRFDRTRVLASQAGLFALVSLLVLAGGGWSWGGLLAAMALFGGLMFTIYPVAVARTHDVFGSREVVAVSSALLLSYGLGATLGPLAASAVMAVSGSPRGLFAYCALVSGGYALGVHLLRRREKVPVIPVERQVEFVPMESTSPLASRLDPRTPADG